MAKRSVRVANGDERPRNRSGCCNQSVGSSWNWSYKRWNSPLGVATRSTQRQAQTAPDVIAVSALSGDAQAPKHGYLKPETDIIRTLVMAANAKGDVLTELRPGASRTSKITLGGTTKGDREEWPVFYAVTTNGSMDSNLWLDLIQRVHARYELRYPGLQPISLLDHHTTHEQFSALKFLVDKLWKCLFFPPHTTHFLQPPQNKH